MPNALVSWALLWPYAWLSAYDSRLRACLLFYGGRVKAQFADDAPAPVTLPNIRCPVMGVFATRIKSPRRKIAITRRRRQCV